MDKRKKVKKLKKDKAKFQAKVSKINNQIEKIEPKKVRTFGDPVVEFM